MFKNFIKKLIYRNKADGDTYINYLRGKGCRIGEGTKIYSPRNTIIDEQRPWLIEIGNNVQITDGVRILTHGYDWAVLKVKYGDVLGSSGKVKIGNNVFIGVNTTILKGVTVGNDIIIGANSLINKDLIQSGVYVGNPAKYIMSLDDYYNKRLAKQLDEAYECACEYYDVYNKWPCKEVFREFFWLFEDSADCLCETFTDVMHLEGNVKQSYEKFTNKITKFKNYDDFISYVKKRYNDDYEDNK